MKHPHFLRHEVSIALNHRFVNCFIKKARIFSIFFNFYLYFLKK